MRASCAIFARGFCAPCRTSALRGLQSAVELFSSQPNVVDGGQGFLCLCAVARCHGVNATNEIVVVVVVHSGVIVVYLTCEMLTSYFNGFILRTMYSLLVRPVCILCL